MSRKTLSAFSTPLTLSSCLALLFVIALLCLLGPSLAAPIDSTLDSIPEVGPIPPSPNTTENQRSLAGPGPSQAYVLYWDEIVLGIVFMVLGIIECFWGYRLIRLSMFVVGFLVFSSTFIFIVLLAAGGSLSTSISAGWAIIFFWFLSGIIGSVVCFIFWHLGLAFLAMYGGFQLGLAISGFANIHSYPARIVLILALMVVFVLLTRLEERHVIIIATSLGGAFTFVWGIDEFAHQGFRQMTTLLGPNGSGFRATPGLWGELAVVVVVFAAGTGYEYWAHETPDPSNLFGDGTRKAQEEIKHVEEEVEGALKRFWKKKEDNNPPSTSSSSSSSWWAFKPKTNASTPPAPIPGSSPAGHSSWVPGWLGNGLDKVRGWFRKDLDKGKGKEGEVPARSWWGWLTRTPRGSEPIITDGQMEDIHEITG